MARMIISSYYSKTGKLIAEGLEPHGVLMTIGDCIRFLQSENKPKSVDESGVYFKWRFEY